LFWHDVTVERTSNESERPDYGIDAPGLVRRFLLIGFISSIVGGALFFGSQAGLPSWTRFAVPPAITIGVWAGVIVA